MTRNWPDPTLPNTLAGILRTRQKVHSTFRHLVGWLKHATSKIELGAGFGASTYQVIDPKCFNDGFVKLRSAAAQPCTANALPSTDLN